MVRTPKLCGVFAADVAETHELTDGITATLTPHSRYNDLDERALVDKGYLILTRSSQAGVDAFVKEGAALETFWQGHPEYEADTLARELRRDLQRFASGVTRVPPSLPENYLTPKAQARLRTYLADVGQGGVLTAETLTFTAFAPETGPGAENSRRLIGAVLAASFQRKRLRHAAETAEAPLV